MHPLRRRTKTTDFTANVALIEKGVATKEGRFLVRVLRTLTAQRRRLTKDLLARLVSQYYAQDVGRRDELLALLGAVRATAVAARHPRKLDNMTHLGCIRY